MKGKKSLRIKTKARAILAEGQTGLWNHGGFRPNGSSMTEAGQHHIEQKGELSQLGPAQPTHRHIRNKIFVALSC